MNLNGVTRGAVFDLSAKLKIEVVEANLGYFDLYTADEVFVTGTAAEIGPISKIDGRIIGTGKPGPVTKKLMKAYTELTRKTGTPINK